MSVIQGFVESIIFKNPVNGYAVLNVESNRRKVTVVGTFSAIEAGIEISAEGEYVEDSRYGRQFRAVSWHELEAQGAPAMQRYLASGAIKGIGDALAERIVSKFRDDTFRIIEEEPERLAEIKGISENKARQIAIAFEEKSHTRRAMMRLAEYGISGGLALRLYEKYGEDIFFVIESDPYSLTEEMEGIGFKIADDIARRAGVSADSPSRIRSGIVYVLGRARSDGHVCLPVKELTGRAGELLQAPADIISEELAGLIMNRRVVQRRYNDTSYIYPIELYHKESECARMLFAIDSAVDSEEVSVEEEIARSEILSGITLDPVQREGVAEAIKNGVLVITGGPGTGKTTLIRVLLSYYGSKGMLVTLAAPTGRAAKRLSEATGVPATTIHRMLEVNGGVEDEDRTFIQFDRNAENPLETNVVIIDEMSMVDTYLFHALLSAIDAGTHLIMVGDDKQLPSVGPGAVLKDIIDSGVIKVITLKHVFRQAEKSDIVKNAHAMLEGRDIRIDNKNSEDFYFLEMDDEDRIIEGIIYLVQKKLSGYLGINPYEIQVMAPMKKGELGIVNLNERLRAALNPRKSEEEIKGSFGSFRVGDKVMQVKNNYELNWLMERKGSALRESGKGVFNGDMGTVTDIYDSETMRVLFDDGRAAVYSKERLSELELSFAITIHKSQGSEYPAVVVPILSGPDVLMTRNILYTAITRAKRCVVLIGSKKTVMSMIRNDREQLRYTGLRFALETIYKDGEN